MLHEAYVLFFILLGTLGLFIWGFWRYDVVAAIALMACVIVGAVPFSAAFSGFGNPAVITVAVTVVVLVFILGLHLNYPFAIPIAAFGGCLLALCVVYGLSRRRQSPS